ncbi:MAG TPA: acetate uptake transporter [Chloroflexota bacterium]|nr:acetate uptake transporter [Chloroflexota bacterium]
MATNLEAPTATVAPPAADPAPLGLAGFALTTLLLSAANAGLLKTPGDLVWVGMAFFYGGLAQFAAGMWEFRNRNTFGATAFGSFGAFWMGLAIMIALQIVGRPLAAGSAVIFYGGNGTIWFLFAWALFTTYMFVASLRTNGAVALVFLLLALTFIALWLGALGDAAPGSGLTAVGGWLGLATALVAFYTSFAGVTNSTFGRVILPVFPFTRA